MAWLYEELDETIDKIINPSDLSNTEAHNEVLKKAYNKVKEGKSILWRGKDGRLRFGLPGAPGVYAKECWSSYKNEANELFMRKTENLLNERDYHLVSTEDKNMPEDDNTTPGNGNTFNAEPLNSYEAVKRVYEQNNEKREDVIKAVNDVYHSSTDNLESTEDGSKYKIKPEEAAKITNKLREKLLNQVACSKEYIKNNNSGKYDVDYIIESVFGINLENFQKSLTTNGKVSLEQFNEVGSQGARRYFSGVMSKIFPDIKSKGKKDIGKKAENKGILVPEYIGIEETKNLFSAIYQQEETERRNKALEEYQNLDLEGIVQGD